MRILKKGYINPKKSIFVAVSVLFLLASVAYALDLNSADSVIVVDANEKKVGNIVGDREGGTPRIAFDIDKFVFFLSVRLNSLDGTDVLHFENVDCMGTPYLSLTEPNGAVVPNVSVAIPGHTLYVPDFNAGSQLIITKSFYLFTEPHTCINSTDSTPTSYFPAIAVIDFDNVFTPPFKMQALKTKKIKLLPK